MNEENVQGYTAAAASENVEPALSSETEGAAVDQAAAVEAELAPEMEERETADSEVV